MDLNYTYWREREVVGGGEKWSLVDGAGITLATIVRLPGTRARVYWREGVATGMKDYASVPEARNAVEAHLAAL